MNASRCRLRLTLMMAMMAAIWPLNGRAAESGVVRSDRVNVRGKASLQGEVVTQLRKGEPVAILEEIPASTQAKKEAGAPSAWLKIKMPANTPVWVNASHVDPATKTVTVRRLNIRGGAGENFSVLGTLDKGAVLKEIRTVEDWMEVEAPTNTFGFVAADLVTRDGSSAEPPVSSSALGKAAESKPLPVRDLSPPPVVTTPPPVQISATPPATANPALTQTRPPATPPPVVVVTPPAPAVTPAPAMAVAPADKDEPLPKRVISREGVVKRALNIQAPSDFQLVSVETGKILNYLLTRKLGFSFEDFAGRKLLVTGEELVDKRWPNTPMIEIETFRIVP